MARIAGVDLPAKKRSEIGLTYIFGIGRTRARSILYRAGVDFDTKIADLTEEQVNKIRTILEAEGAVEGDLRKEVSLNGDWRISPAGTRSPPTKSENRHAASRMPVAAHRRQRVHEPSCT